VGTSRLGGLPDLPPSLPWPRWANDPFDFIAQVNLAEVHRAVAGDAALLPSTGMLYFFFALGFSGGDVEDLDWRGGGRVLYFPGPETELVATALPPGMEAQRVLAPRSMTFRSEGPMLPPAESPFYPELLGGGEYGMALSRASQTFGPLLHALGAAAPLGGPRDDRPRQRLLGYADPLNNSPNVNCEGTSSGLSPTAWTDHPDFWHRAANWALLFQADSEVGDPDVLLGDDGLLYFMIRPLDLAARRFDRVWTDWQAH
jgi:hypothetical protein